MHKAINIKFSNINAKKLINRNKKQVLSHIYNIGK